MIYKKREIEKKMYYVLKLEWESDVKLFFPQKQTKLHIVK